MSKSVPVWCRETPGADDVIRISFSFSSGLNLDQQVLCPGFDGSHSGSAASISFSLAHLARAVSEIWPNGPPVKANLRVQMDSCSENERTSDRMMSPFGRLNPEALKLLSIALIMHTC